MLRALPCTNLQADPFHLFPGLVLTEPRLVYRVVQLISPFAAYQSSPQPHVIVVRCFVLGHHGALFSFEIHIALPLLAGKSYPNPLELT